ncbi:hypothetical protein BC936DRAFT_147585 [Jimgerdemannia flammicorona]|uniref:Uncharacterized protein n=1 Tax=Jimgerdemannia flammicorona TaxID=994334 RepID=A0A433DKW0_9FUNG|nr:hypothetical protein BC936DRAFT_147585 [Jimgerdemannia flammicorona]
MHENAGLTEVIGKWKARPANTVFSEAVTALRIGNSPVHALGIWCPLVTVTCGKMLGHQTKTSNRNRYTFSRDMLEVNREKAIVVGNANQFLVNWPSLRQRTEDDVISGRTVL